MTGKVELQRSKSLKIVFTLPSTSASLTMLVRDWRQQLFQQDKQPFMSLGKVVWALYSLGGFPGITIPIGVNWQILPCADKVWIIPEARSYNMIIYSRHSASPFLLYITYCIQNPFPTLSYVPVCLCACRVSTPLIAWVRSALTHRQLADC